MDGWKMSFLLGRPIFRDYVSFREGNPNFIQRFVGGDLFIRRFTVLQPSKPTNIPWKTSFWIGPIFGDEHPRRWTARTWKWCFGSWFSSCRGVFLRFHAKNHPGWIRSFFWREGNLNGWFICFVKATFSKHRRWWSSPTFCRSHGSWTHFCSMESLVFLP